MTTVNVYLTFEGNCEEAFNHYKSVFGGEFSGVNRFKDMPPQEEEGMEVPESDGNKIMHMSLPISAETALMGSDAVGQWAGQTVFGTNFSISINTDTMDRAEHLYNGLAEGGHATMPLAPTFWSKGFGMLTDKFGINWMISLEHKDA